MFEKFDYEIIQGDSLETLKTLPDESVQVCVTSPPYYGLRDYGTGKWVGGDPLCPHKRLNKTGKHTSTGHAQTGLLGNVGDSIYKQVCPLCGAVREDKQIGLEQTPEEYIEKLVTIFREVRRVLKPDGTLWVNIGDSYVGSGSRGSNYDDFNNIGDNLQTNSVGTLNRENVPKFNTSGGYKNKDLIGIPWMLAFALRADGWYLRQDIIWSKKNPLPESVADRCTKSHEYVFLLSKSPTYYFDMESIEEPANYDGRHDTLLKGSTKYSNDDYLQNKNGQSFANGPHERWKFKSMPKFGGNKYGDNDDSHYQTYSGNEWTPKYKNLQYDGQQPNSFHIARAEGSKDKVYAVRHKRDVWVTGTSRYKGAHFATFPEELIEPMILAGCPEGEVVLDVFSGSGTTGVVALRQNKKYIGLELNQEYVDLSIKRINESLGKTVTKEQDSEEVEIVGRKDLW